MLLLLEMPIGTHQPPMQGETGDNRRKTPPPGILLLPAMTLGEQEHKLLAVCNGKSFPSLKLQQRRKKNTNGAKQQKVENQKR